MRFPPKFGVTAGLSLGTQAELKNSFLGQDWGSGSCFPLPLEATQGVKQRPQSQCPISGQKLPSAFLTTWKMGQNLEMSGCCPQTH